MTSYGFRNAIFFSITVCVLVCVCMCVCMCVCVCRAQERDKDVGACREDPTHRHWGGEGHQRCTQGQDKGSEETAPRRKKAKVGVSTPICMRVQGTVNIAVCILKVYTIFHIQHLENATYSNFVLIVQVHFNLWHKVGLGGTSDTFGFLHNRNHYVRPIGDKDCL